MNLEKKIFYGESAPPPPTTTTTRIIWETSPPKQECVESLGNLWAGLRPVSGFERIHATSGWDNTDIWCFCRAGRFSYGESPRTPPPEGTSPHRRNMSVERPWGILSLFTTCLPVRVNSRAWVQPVFDYEWICLARGCDTDVHVAALWSRSFFLRWITADPSPWGNFTPPTKNECGETLGDLEPVYDLFPITSNFALP